MSNVFICKCLHKVQTFFLQNEVTWTYYQVKTQQRTVSNYMQLLSILLVLVSWIQTSTCTMWCKMWQVTILESGPATLLECAWLRYICIYFMQQSIIDPKESIINIQWNKIMIPLQQSSERNIALSNQF